MQFIGISIFLFELKHATESIIVASIKSRGTEFHIFNKADVKDALRTSAATLCGKMVDNGHFDTIEIENVFRGCATAYDDVVSETTACSASTHTRQGLNHFADVEIATRIRSNIFCGESLNAKWTFKASGTGCIFSAANGNITKLTYRVFYLYK